MFIIIFSKQKKDQNRKRKLEKEEITTPTAAPNPVQKENFRQRMYYVPKLVMNPRTKKIDLF